MIKTRSGERIRESKPVKEIRERRNGVIWKNVMSSRRAQRKTRKKEQRERRSDRAGKDPDRPGCCGSRDHRGGRDRIYPETRRPLQGAARRKIRRSRSPRRRPRRRQRPQRYRRQRSARKRSTCRILWTFNLDEAEKILQGLDLSMQVEQENSDGVEKGMVISQKEEPDTVIPRFSKVTVVISAGSDKVDLAELGLSE